MSAQPCCEYCMRPLFGMEIQPTDAGKLLHWSCREAESREDAEALKVFEVDVTFRGRATVTVAARSAAEAEELVQEGYICVDPDDTDIRDVEADQSNAPMRPDLEAVYASAIQLRNHREAEREVRRRLREHKASGAPA